MKSDEFKNVRFDLGREFMVEVEFKICSLIRKDKIKMMIIEVWLNDTNEVLYYLRSTKDHNIVREFSYTEMLGLEKSNESEAK